MVNHIFPRGVVALDVDSPIHTNEYYYGEPGRPQMVAEVRAWAQDLSEQFGLGRFWMYHTLSGLHVIFEIPAVAMWDDVMTSASLGDSWHECWGHIRHCEDAGDRAVLRVSRKVEMEHTRPWDIIPADDNPPLQGAPPHVLAHCDALLTHLCPWA